MVLDHHVLAFDVTGFAEALAERNNREFRDSARPPADEADERHHPLLRVHRERPRGRRAAEQRDELAPSHYSITSSARASSLSGIASPSALAALRLITNSNLVGCVTGSSS